MINTEYKNEDVLVTHDIREIQGYSGAFCECGATLHIKTPLYAKWCVIECPKCKHIVQLYFGKKRIFEDEMLKDIHMLIGNWFCALEDEGCDPWKDPECIAMAWKYGYTKKKYNKFLSTIY